MNGPRSEISKIYSVQRSQKNDEHFWGLSPILLFPLRSNAWKEKPWTTSKFSIKSSVGTVVMPNLSRSKGDRAPSIATTFLPCTSASCRISDSRRCTLQGESMNKNTKTWDI